MLISDFRELTPSPEVAVIINAGTKYVSTLALLSTLRYARIPAVMIDCESHDGSFEWFSQLMADHDFHLMSAKLRPHGETLDWVFDRVVADRVLLVDSDAEMLNDDMLSQMRSALESSSRLYGSGYLHPAHWLERHYFSNLPLAPGIGYYMERMWIPFTLLRVEAVRSALKLGSSFMHRLVLNDFPQLPLLSKLLWRRFRFEVFRRHRLSWLDGFRRSYDGMKPSYLSYDTGADLHECLTSRLNLAFGGTITAAVVPWSVTHFSGITRSVLSEKLTEDVYRLSTAQPIVIERLRNLYGVQIGD
jgi:hypothetical protein